MVVCEVDLAIAEAVVGVAVAAASRALAARARLRVGRVLSGRVSAVALAGGLGVARAARLRCAVAYSIGSLAADHLWI